MPRSSLPECGGQLVLIVLLGVIVGLREGWSVQDSIYFAFITALSIGYGDPVPTAMSSRTLAVITGGCGMLVTALVAAIAVRAITVLLERRNR